MIILTQYLVRYCIILPAFETESLITGEYPTHLNDLNFLLLVLSTVLIAAGGYIINDVYDVETDAINKPGKNIVGSLISSRTATIVFLSLSLSGIVIGFYIAWLSGILIMAGIQIFTAISLWMYASYYKRRFLSGNMLISFLTALSILITGLYEPEFYRNFSYLLIYAIPAFGITLVREVIKDMEDLDGDERTQCKTIPVRLGLKKTKGVVQLLILINVILIFCILYKYFYGNIVINFWMLVAMFVIPFAALSYLVKNAQEKSDYYYAGVYTKFIMLAGILTMIPFYYYFLR